MGILEIVYPFIFYIYLNFIVIKLRVGGTNMSLSYLADLYRDTVSKMKNADRLNSESQPDVAYPTGFLTFDYMNGNVVYVNSEKLNFRYDAVGIVDGSVVYTIGRSGCGKTTFMFQAAGNIIRPYKSSCIYFDNAEGGMVDTRKQQLLKLHGEQISKKLIERNTGITAENVYERVKIIHDLKMENRESFEYDTGLYDSNGKKILKFEPTIYMLDSLAMLTPEKYTEEEELSGQMSATAAAKTNTTVFKRLIPLLKEANIIFMVINHITESVDINMFSKKQGMLSYLKPNERLGGGRAVVYVANLLIRLDDHSKLKESEGFGIAGSLVDVTVLKSRTAIAGSQVTLVFDFDNGFDTDLSLLYFLKQKKLVNGAGAFLYFGDRSDMKFAQKNFKTKLRTDPEFRKLVMETAIPALRELITDHGPAKEYCEDGDFDLSSAILSSINIQNAA